MTSSIFREGVGTIGCDPYRSNDGDVDVGPDLRYVRESRRDYPSFVRCEVSFVVDEVRFGVL